MIENTGTQLLTDFIAYSLKGQRCSSGYTLSRYAMYKALEQSLHEQDSEAKTCLAISKSVEFGRILGLKNTSMVSSDYPQCNLVDLQFADEAFDFVISDQVLEHVEGPVRGVQ